MIDEGTREGSSRALQCRTFRRESLRRSDSAVVPGSASVRVSVPGLFGRIALRNGRNQGSVNGLEEIADTGRLVQEEVHAHFVERRDRLVIQIA